VLLEVKILTLLYIVLF